MLSNILSTLNSSILVCRLLYCVVRFLCVLFMAMFAVKCDAMTSFDDCFMLFQTMTIKFSMQVYNIIE